MLFATRKSLLFDCNSLALRSLCLHHVANSAIKPELHAPRAVGPPTKIA
jgi:hypothetical protein